MKKYMLFDSDYPVVDFSDFNETDELDHTLLRTAPLFDSLDFATQVGVAYSEFYGVCMTLLSIREVTVGDVVKVGVELDVGSTLPGWVDP